MKVEVVNYEETMNRLDRDFLAADALSSMKSRWVATLFGRLMGTVPRDTGAYAASFALEGSSFEISSSSEALRPIEGGHEAPDGTFVAGSHAISRMFSGAASAATEPLRVAIAAIERKWGSA